MTEKTRFRYKHSVLILVISLLVGTIWYFGTWAWAIGTPSGAEVTYWDTQQQRRTISLTGEQLELLSDQLQRTTPTLFLHEGPGLNNEDVLISLSYANGRTNVFSLWSNRSILYEGNAENLTMAAMLGSMFHYGGNVAPDLQTFLQELTRM
ncbi:MAG: hypothetical protein IJN29_09590 [Akkermansia sp.]|nr:hypothetical protein [Akkermansia sp.]